jgi:hypothetical protein
VFKVRQVGKTLVNRTAGTRIASDGLKGRVYEVSLADLQSENDAERSFRKFKLICEDVQVPVLQDYSLSSVNNCANPEPTFKIIRWKIPGAPTESTILLESTPFLNTVRYS